MRFGGGKRWLDDLDRDIQDHIELETRENIERGMAPDEARYAALRKFGNTTRVLEDTRAVWHPVWLEQLTQDIRYALRTLRRQPAFTAVVVATLALGIGMNTAVFSVLNTVLFRPLPYPDAGRLIWLANYNQQWKQDNWVARTDYRTWKQQALSFEKMAAYGNQDLAVVSGGESSQERIASVTGDFWEIAGAQPASGRLFQAGEWNTAVLSRSLFERRFGGDAGVIGKTITVNGWPFTIVGVLPKNFRFLFPQQFAGGDEVREIDAYIPIPDTLMAMPPSGVQRWEEAIRRFGPAPFWIVVVGKRRADVPFEKARAEMQTIYSRIAEQDPNPLRVFRILRFTALQDKLAGETRRALVVLLVAVGFVLLIACANIANLLLARASARQREIAIRAAVGAGRMRVVRQFLAESVLLALLGCAAGLLLAQWAISVLPRLAPQAVPRLAETTIDGRVLAFTLAVSVFSGLFCGLAPVIYAWRAEVFDVLKAETGTSSAASGRIRLRGVLVASQIALAVVLLAGAGLMLKSFWRMNAKPAGFAPDKILVMRVALSGSQYSTWSPKQAYTEELLQTLQALPGVEAAGVDAGTLNTNVQVDDGVPSPGGGVPASIRGVSPGYLRAIGIPLLKGAWPERGNLFGVVVNEAFARRIAGGEATGKHLSGSILNDTITGVVADFKTWQLDAEPLPEVYLPYERLPLNRSMRVVVRAEDGAAALAPVVRQLVAGIDRTQPVYEFQTLQDALSASIAPRRFNLFLLGAFAATALLLAVIGIYGVMAYSVSQRTREIGIRMALGARRGEIIGMVVRQGMKLALAGIVAGIPAGIALTRLMKSLLYGVNPGDPWIFALVVAALVAAALLAAGGPALKAARVDPLTALRYE
ncbi:MAG TPA: ABC transporter permease [Bryobacteraceae bacterium]|nr:ABC transporter permease [Bryobacteraceae bacterium]